MPTYYADSFTQSFEKLGNKEQNLVKILAWDLNNSKPTTGTQFHRVEKSKDPDFWSLRVNSDLRIIVHKQGPKLMICYVDHHDKAYDWARRRRLETHPVTGSVQFVVIPEVEEKVAHTGPKAKRPWAHLSEATLLEQGVPPGWIKAVQQGTEEDLDSWTRHLPGEAVEALLQWATGNQPLAPATNPGQDPMVHPDTQRRFRLIGNAGELQQALDFTWEKWTVFLHPEQRKIVEADYGKPARVCGSAGTGKTIVALHRAFRLAVNHSKARVFLTTFSDPLAKSLQAKLKILGDANPEALERIDVRALDTLGQDLFKARIGPEKMLGKPVLMDRIRAAYEKSPPVGFSVGFVLTEWEHILDAWQLESFEAYEKFSRVGTRRRLTSSQRRVLWDFFEPIKQQITEAKGVSQSELFTRLAKNMTPESSPYEFVVVDESQDLSVAQLRFLASLGGNRKNGLFFAGDSGQQIFQRPFAWKDLGLDIRGRSKILKINYRTSQQIRQQTDRLLDTHITDSEGEIENRRDVISLFAGPNPQIQTFASIKKEIAGVGDWIKETIAEGVLPQEIGLIVRGAGQFHRAKDAAAYAGVGTVVLDRGETEKTGYIRIASMQEAKGLEFKAVAVMACDDKVIPSQDLVESLGDVADLDMILQRERHLLYVGCTRARDALWVSGVEPISEYLVDMQKGKLG